MAFTAEKDEFSKFFKIYFSIPYKNQVIDFYMIYAVKVR